MIKDTLGKAARALRAAVFALGVAVTLAAVLGVATTANAAVGDSLKLGRLNTVNKLTQLVGSVDGAMLSVDNNNASEGATALDLQVEAGKAPMKVNPEAGTATNLSADELDGKDSRAFLPTTTYIRDQVTEGDGGANQISSAQLSCLEGDVLLGGGVTGIDAGTRFVASFPSNDSRTWIVSWANDGTVDSNLVRVYCANL